MIEINNLTKFKFDKKRLEKLVGKVLERERKTAIDLSITFVGPKEIQNLNKKYRKIDSPTDVLSFTYKNSGEIVICPQVVTKNAERFSDASGRELGRVLIHGVLHILGYDHERLDGKMIKKQEKYLSKLQTTNY